MSNACMPRIVTGVTVVWVARMGGGTAKSFLSHYKRLYLRSNIWTEKSDKLVTETDNFSYLAESKNLITHKFSQMKVGCIDFMLKAPRMSSLFGSQWARPLWWWAHWGGRGPPCVLCFMRSPPDAGSLSQPCHMFHIYSMHQFWFHCIFILYYPCHEFYWEICSHVA